MQVDADLAEIMNKYKPGSATGLTNSDQNAEFEAVSDEEIEEPKDETSTVTTASTTTADLPDTPQSPSPTGNAVGVVAATPPAQEQEVKRPSDKEALEVIKTRFEDLWRLEADHAKLKVDYSNLEQAKVEVEKQRDDWQEKYKALEKKLKETEEANGKLNHKVEAEKERYTLLSGQFEELNNKLVEIVNNVTHMKPLEEPALRSPRKSTDTPNKTQTGLAGFFTTTPVKPKQPPGTGRK